MKTRMYKIQFLILSLSLCLVSCEDYLEVGTPDYKISTETVFSSDETAKSAMQGIYNQLMRASFSEGFISSVTVLSGLSAHELKSYNVNNITFTEFEQNEISPLNSGNFNLWESAYNVIYMTNSLLEGLQISTEITESTQKSLEGQARFIRAFTYFYLVNLYGEVPLIITTDYRSNSLVERDTNEIIYSQIISDLQNSVNLLKNNYDEGERTKINKFTALALLARVHLFLQNWELAEQYSSEVIEESGTYKIIEDLDKVFLANSHEAIWQLSPAGIGGGITYTNEGSIFIFHPVLAFLTRVQLSESLVNSFEPGDKRRSKWVGSIQGRNGYFAYKYKVRYSTDEVTEYSMVLRLAEQFLIRSESRAMQGNLAGAISDLDVIRQRAGLELIADINPQISKEDLLDAILEERKKELFTEWGHRWLDLKRTGKAKEILSPETSFWEDTDVLYPIPEEERLKNPNLTQNPGY